MKVSTLEILNLSKHVLQAIKFPIGYANTASHNILWGEILEGRGLSSLKAHCNEIENKKINQPQFIINSGKVASIDGQNNSILLTGLCALDLACSKASKLGLGVAHVTNSIGFPYLYHIANLANQRDYLCLILSGLKETDASYSKGTNIFLPTTDGPYIIDSKMKHPPKLLNIFKEQLLFNVFEQQWEWKTFMNFNKPIEAKIKNGSVELISQILAYSCQAEEEHNNGADDLVVFCLKLNTMSDIERIAKRIIDLISNEQSKHIQMWKSIDHLQIWDTAVKEGIEVDEILWNELLEFRKAVFVPNSEKSRIQGAG
jgi:LDH2 family malate/lactate/ureidoglycolate dehydrogenase